MKTLKRILFTITCLLLPTLLSAVPIGYRLCQDSAHFSCYKVKRADTWENLFPGMHDRNLVMRLNRMNIPLYSGLHLAVPKNPSTDIEDYSPFPSHITPPGSKLIVVSINPNVLAWGAYESNGSLAAWGPAVGARGYCPDMGRGCHTALGHFEIYKKEGRDCVSSKFPIPRGGAPMPWCMYFHGGFALHGSYEVPGFNASHGCIRMFVPDAEWLNQEFTNGEKEVQVFITNNP